MNDPLPQTIPPLNQPAFDKFLGLLLNTPLRFLSGDNFLYLTYKGRKTGSQRALPVQYATHGSDLVVFVTNSPKTSWWRNFKTEHPISAVRKGRRIQCTGVVVDAGSAEGVELATAYFLRHPSAAERHGLKGVTKTSSLDPESVRAGVSGDVLVKLTPTR